jgi:hypothetical protein
MRLPYFALLIVSCSVAGSALAQSARPDSLGPARIAVIGNDYAFSQLPATVPAGPTLFSFENRGKVRHEMSMILLKPGVTLQQILDLPGSATGRATAESLIGLLIARPGEAGGGQLLVDLRVGQRYLVVCSLKDMPEGQPHAKLGMVTIFEVVSHP